VKIDQASENSILNGSIKRSIEIEGLY